MIKRANLHPYSTELLVNTVNEETEAFVEACGKGVYLPDESYFATFPQIPLGLCLIFLQYNNQCGVISTCYSAQGRIGKNCLKYKSMLLFPVLRGSTGLYAYPE